MSLLAAEWGTGQVFWSILWFFLFFIWIWMLIAVFSDIFRSHDLSGWGKALWSIFIIFLPYLGVFVYLIARGHKMSEHAVAEAQAQDASVPAVRPPGRRHAAASTADELERLAKLHQQGILDDAEYATAKAKALGLTRGVGSYPRRA